MQIPIRPTEAVITPPAVARGVEMMTADFLKVAAAASAVDRPGETRRPLFDFFFSPSPFEFGSNQLARRL